MHKSGRRMWIKEDFISDACLKIGALQFLSVLSCLWLVWYVEVWQACQGEVFF